MTSLIAGATWSAPRRRLDDVLSSHDNNLDLLRLIAALAVIWSHAELFEGTGLPDPFEWLFSDHQDAGKVGVMAFFLISGLLIPASMERQRSPVTFVISRYARLTPGLVAFTAFAAFLLAPSLSGYPIDDHLALREARHCTLGNLAFPFDYVCQGVSMAFPHSSIVEGWGFPLWTLPVEVHCYGLVLVVGTMMGGRMTTTLSRSLLYFIATCGAIVLFWISRDAPFTRGWLFEADFTLVNGYTTYPVLFFLGGMMLYGARRHVVIDRVAALVISTIAFALPFDPWVVYPAACYAILALAADPSLRHLQPRWDLSFGLYMYGAAMGQVAFAMIGPGAPWLYLAITVPLAALCSIASHLLVESPGLSAGRFLSRRYRAVRTIWSSAVPAFAGHLSRSVAKKR